MSCLKCVLTDLCPSKHVKCDAPSRNVSIGNEGVPVKHALNSTSSVDLISFVPWAGQRHTDLQIVKMLTRVVHLLLTKTLKKLSCNISLPSNYD